MLLRKALTLTVAAGILAAVNAVSASAQTFASFSYGGPATTSYNNATGVFSGLNIPILFTFDASDPLGIPSVVGNTPQNATLTFTATRTGNATLLGSFIDQSLVINSFNIKRVGGGNLLSGSGIEPSDLIGKKGSITATLSSSLPPAGTSIGFLSDYLTFPTPAADGTDLTWTLENIKPTATGLGIVGANFGNFQSSIAGTFAYQSNPTAVPEPGSLALLSGLGVCGTVFGMSRLRRRK